MHCLIVAMLALFLASIARAEVRPLRVDPKTSLSLSLTSGALAAGMATSYAKPGDCRICGAGSLDRDLRASALWSDPRSAGIASDVIVNGVLPGAILLNSSLAAWSGGQPYAAVEDSMIILEAVMLAADLNAISKNSFARRRPSAGLSATGSANRSFYSGHTSMAFSLATAAGTVSTLRGYRSAPWVWAGGLLLASAVGYLRVASNAHWPTDVAVGALAGGAVGFAVPWTLHRLEAGRARRAVDVLPAPGGLALVF